MTTTHWPDFCLPQKWSPKSDSNVLELVRELKINRAVFFDGSHSQTVHSQIPWRFPKQVNLWGSMSSCKKGTVSPLKFRVTIGLLFGEIDGPG